MRKRRSYKPTQRCVVLDLEPEIWTALDMIVSDQTTSMRKVVSSLISEIVRDDMAEERKRAA